MKHDQQALAHPSPAEPRMKVRDADLRRLMHQYRAGPGTDLYPVLRELQKRWDEARGDRTTPHRCQEDPGGGRA